MTSKSKKVGIIVAVILAVIVIIAISIAITQILKDKNPTQQNDSSSSSVSNDIQKDDKQDNKQDNQQDNKNNDGNFNQNSNQTDETNTDLDENDKQDDKQDSPIVEKTEEEYKATFEEALPSIIENYFNENLAIANFLKIDDVKISLINNASGSVYVNCTQQGTNKFMELQCSDLKNAASYKSLSENISNMIFTTENNKGETVQEEGLANEIVSYALEQDKVQEYLLSNGIDYTNYEILNVSEFRLGDKGDTSNLSIKFNDKIFSMTLGGVTGYYSSQEDCLQQLKDGRLSVLDDFELENYNELEISSAESNAV